MVSEYIKNTIYEAHSCLRVNDPKHKDIILEALEMLNNLDVLATDDEARNIIADKKQKVENSFNKQQDDIKKIGDPFGHSKEEMKNLRWKLKEYISFYNRLNMDNRFG